MVVPRYEKDLGTGFRASAPGLGILSLPLENAHLRRVFVDSNLGWSVRFPSSSAGLVPPCFKLVGAAINVSTTSIFTKYHM